MGRAASSISVTITGTPGTWQFNVSKTGHQANSWLQTITATCEKHAYLVKQPATSQSPSLTINPASTVSARIDSYSANHREVVVGNIEVTTANPNP